MSKFKKLTTKNMDEVFVRILNMDKEQRDVIAESFNEVLEDLFYEDFFGTEGQLDPRGDRRE